MHPHNFTPSPAAHFLGACCAAFFLTLLPSPTEARADRRAGPTVIIGVDGMTFDVLDPMLQSGRLPHFAALLQQGTRAILRSEVPMRSPALWTTIATGQPRDVHRIYDFVTGSRYWPRDQRSGPQALVTSDMRRSPALWNMVEKSDKKSLVVGWLNTWPAERISGVMVAPYVALGQSKQTSIKGKIYDSAEQQTYPASRFAALRPFVVSAPDVTPQQMNSIVDVPPTASPLFGHVPQLRRFLYTVRWSIASTLTNTAMVEQQLKQDTFDLVMTYFDGSDTLAHRFWVLRQPLPVIRARLEAHGVDPSIAPELKRRFGQAVDNYYALVDECLGRIMAQAGKDATILVVSDHGWGNLKRTKAFHDHVPFDGQHELDGVLIAKGPGIQQGKSTSAVTLYDIVPTALYTMGVPIQENLPGGVATELFEKHHLAAQPPVFTKPEFSPRAEKPQRKPKQPDAKTPFEDEELERLRSLGYVQ